MPLQLEQHGHGPRLVLVHGFTQTRRCWAPVDGDLSTDHEVVSVDAPGHGGSADVTAGVADGGELIAARCGPATYLGYSMGARFALHAALARPDLVHGLVLLGGTAGIEDEDERSRRRDQDRETAARLRRHGLSSFLDEWLRQPLFAGLPPDRAFRAERLENTVDGLARSLVQAGTGAQEPSWHRLGGLSMPVLVLAGSDDHKFAALAARLAQEIGANATLGQVEGAGHAAHLEQPERFLAAVRPWLARHHL